MRTRSLQFDVLHLSSFFLGTEIHPIFEPFPQPAQQFVARVCSTLLKRALTKEVPAITKSGISKSLADLQQTFINSSVAALEKRGVQIYKLLESMLKTNKETANANKAPSKVAIFKTR